MIEFKFSDFSEIFNKLVLLKGKTFDDAKTVFEGHSYSVQYNRGKPFIVKIRLTEGEVTVVFHRERLDRVEFEFWEEKGEKKEKEVDA